MINVDIVYWHISAIVLMTCY